MKILISTFGTHGDVQPFLALGCGLRAAGHSVAICTSASYRPIIEGLGLQHAFMSDTMLELTRSLLNGSGSTLTTIRRMGPAMRTMMEEEWQAAHAFGPDLMVYHPKMLGSYHIAEKLNCPLVMAIPLPFYTPTRAFPNPFFAGLRLGGWANRASYRLLGLAGSMYSGMINRFRSHTLGLPALPRFADLLMTRDGAPIPILYPYSPQLLPIPTDFPPHVHVTGYWFLERDAGWEPPASLAAFLAAGPPPIYVGFGSMGRRGAKRRTEVVLDALAQAGQRGVLARGWGSLAPDVLPGSVYALDEAPHDWLFPRMAAVVHHGGAGTTAAGLRAGKPTVICPVIGDQPFWGRIVAEQGLGPQPISQRKLTAARLATAIQAVVGDPAMGKRAAALGTQIQAEHGVTNAVAILEHYLSQPHPLQLV